VVERDIDIGTHVGVPGVPAVFVNRSRVDNPLDEAVLKNAIREARDRP
jgi:protein-disulfide isomerase